ncbi:MAG: ABC transporter ATP-binding protein [Candidatus Thermoplasmatota archaeon]|nr:ABC transporter ATP-binding protein [Candidatus Thermoplasmatota archaeon]
MQPLLKAEAIHSGYGDVEIVHNVSVVVNKGELVTIIGPNGAGKSTLIKTIFGLLAPMAGRIWYQGRDVTGTEPDKLVRMGLSYVPQVDNVFPRLTVIENLEMGGFVREGDLTPRIDVVLEMFPSLKEKASVRSRNLSGGEKQMVALGKTLMLDPEVMLIDEPSAGLAPNLVEAVLEKIREINEAGTAIVIVEQNARKALSMAHRGYVLDMGETKYEGTGEDLLADPRVGRMYLGG